MEDNKAVQNISVLNFVTGRSTSVSSEESAKSKFFDDTDCIVMQPITYSSNFHLTAQILVLLPRLKSKITFLTSRLSGAAWT